MARRLKNQPPEIKRPFLWCPTEWVMIEHPKLLSKVRMQRRQLGFSVTNPSAYALESALISEGKKTVDDVKAWLRLTAGECLVCLSVAPRGNTMAATAEAVKSIRIKMRRRLQDVLSWVIFPEPRSNGNAHLNIMLRLMEKDAPNIITTIKRRLKKHMDEYGIWENHITKKVIYTYADQCIDEHMGYIPGPIWYSLKTLLTRAPLKSHDIIAELRQRPKNIEFASVFEGHVWRKYSGLNKSSSRVRKESKHLKVDTITYRGEEIRPIRNRRAFYPPALSSAIRDMKRIYPLRTR